MPLVSCRRRRTHEQLTVVTVGFPVWHFFQNPSRASPVGVAGLPPAQNLRAAFWTFRGAGPSTIMHEAPYEFLLCRDTDPFAGRLLNLRAFDKREKLAAYSRQNGICPVCGEHFEFEEMEGDHIKSWSKGGQTTPDNCQMLCKSCNGKKTDKY